MYLTTIFRDRRIPVLRDLNLERGQVVLEINAGGSVAPLRVVDWPHVVLHAVLVGQLRSDQLMIILSSASFSVYVSVKKIKFQRRICKVTNFSIEVQNEEERQVLKILKNMVS